LKEGGKILVNSDRTIEEFHFPEGYTCAAFNASEIALKYNLGTVTQPIVNTAILGALAKFTGIVSIESVIEAVKEDIPVRPEDNAASAREAYDAFGK